MSATDEFFQSLREALNEPSNPAATAVFWGAVVLGLLALLGVRLWRHYKKRPPKD